MTPRSWRGVIVGSLIALALPIAYFVYAVLLSNQIVPISRSGFLYDLISSLSLNALAELVLAVIGIAIFGRAARIENGWAVLAMWTIAIPLTAVLWFLGYATLGGALGSPF